MFDDDATFNENGDDQQHCCSDDQTELLLQRVLVVMMFMLVLVLAARLMMMFMCHIFTFLRFWVQSYGLSFATWLQFFAKSFVYVRENV